MEVLHTFCIMMTISIMNTVLAQPEVDTTRTERVVTNSRTLEITEAISSGFEQTARGSEMNKDVSSSNVGPGISNEIGNNSSEEFIVKRSTIRAVSTDEPTIDVFGSPKISDEGDLEKKPTTSDKQMTEMRLPSSDSTIESHSDVRRTLPSTKITEVPIDKRGETVTPTQMSFENVSKETFVLESSQAEVEKTEIPGSEDSVSKSLANDFPDNNAEDFDVSSDYSNVERAQASPMDFSVKAIDPLESLSTKTSYSDFKTPKTDGPMVETVKTESVQTQPASETSSLSSITETPEDDVFLKIFDQEQSESQNSMSTAEAEILDSDDSVHQGSNGYDSGSLPEIAPEQSPSVPATHTFREATESSDGLGFKTDHKEARVRSTTVEEDSDETALGPSTQGNTENYAAYGTEEPSEDEKYKTTVTDDNKQLRPSTDTAMTEKSDEASDVTVTELHVQGEDITLSSSEINKSTDGTESNSTRIPKRIQEPRFTETRYRPRPPRPDPGYPYGDDRPYRPDDLSYSREQKPSVDSYTPLRREFDFSRPARPDPYVPGSEFSRHAPDYSRQSPSDSGVPKPYRPQTSFARPYVPQGAFGRPYRPDRDHTKSVSPQDFLSKTTEELPLSSKPDSAFFGASQSETDFSEPSHADDYDGKTSEASESEYQRPHSDIEPLVLTPDVFKPYRPPVDTRVSSDREGDLRPLRPIYLPSSSTVADSDVSKPAVSEFSPKPASKPDSNGDDLRDSLTVQSTKGGEKSRPPASYPRPGFGSNYGQPLGTSPKPFTPGTITLARNNLTRVEYIKADCFDNHMKVSIRFNGSFSGLVYSSGYSQDPTCSYINGSGRYHYEFFIRLNRCGTLGKQEVADQKVDPVTRRRQDRAQYLVNTVTVQYNPVIEEEIDEHFRVTCEYGYDFWKTVTFPVVNVETYLSRSSAMKVRTGSPVVFTLPPPQCNMEIRNGYGPSGIRVGGPVNVGDPLTLVIHMKSESAGFDILVSNCFAHNGAQKRLQLIDSNGCVVQEKLVSPFRGVSSPNRSQQVTLYSYLKAFRFTGSPALYIECDVHMCHGSCPPQRCYWRHLYKRSVENETSEEEDPVISESVSLFQSLEVRNEESDRPNSLAVSTTDGHPDEDMVCFRAAGFAAILASLLVVLVVTCLTSLCLCSRIRKMKTYFESSDTKHFMQFDITTQRK